MAAGRADCPPGRSPVRADGDLSPRHPWGQPRPQATQGRTRPVGPAAPHHARPHAGRPEARAHQDAAALQPARPPGRPLPDPARGRRHRGRACGSSRPSGAPPACTSTAPGSTTGGPSPRRPPRSSTSASPSSSADELYRSDLKVDGVSVLEDLEPEADGRTLRIRPADLVENELVEQALAEGEHRIQLSVGRMFLGDATFSWSYVVDSIAPTLDVPASLAARADRRAGHDRGRGRGGRGAAARRPTDRQRRRHVRGRLRLAAHRVARCSRRSTRPATARRSTWWCRSTTRPRRARCTSAPRRGRTTRSEPAIEDLIDRGLIDTVELDLKDESGIVGYDSELRQGPGDRRGHGRLRPLRDRRPPRGARHPGDRPARRVPRPELRAGGVGGRRPRPGHPDAVGRHVLHLRRASRTSPTRRCAPTTAPSPSRRSRWA